MIMQAEIKMRGEDGSSGDVTPIAFLPSSIRSPPVGPQVYIHHLKSHDAASPVEIQTLQQVQGAHFPIAEMAAALDDSQSNALQMSKILMARRDTATVDCDKRGC